MSAGADHGALVDGLFAAIDAQDADRFADFLTTDVRFRFGAAPPVTGRDAVRATVREFFESIAGLRHAIHRTLVDEGLIVCVGEVTYTRHDESRITLPFADTFELQDGRIADYRIYMDIGPLFAN